jgi:hypothetical protein
MPGPQGNMVPPQPIAPHQNMPQAMNPVAMQYQQQTAPLIPSISEKNPYLKERVGECIFPFIKNFVGNERAPKITGMLIELPVEQIKLYMMNFDNLSLKVKEANDLINQAEQQPK